MREGESKKQIYFPFLQTVGHHDLSIDPEETML